MKKWIMISAVFGALFMFAGCSRYASEPYHFEVDVSQVKEDGGSPFVTSRYMEVELNLTESIVASTTTPVGENPSSYNEEMARNIFKARSERFNPETLKLRYKEAGVKEAKGMVLYTLYNTEKGMSVLSTRFDIDYNDGGTSK